MRALMRLTVIAALLLSGVSLHAQKPKEAVPARKGEQVGGRMLEEPAKSPKPSRDPFDALYPPELVMEHQNELGLNESERQSLRQSVQQAHARFIDLQWRLSAETERLGTLIHESKIDERDVLEQVDRVLALERELKRTRIALLVRIKNTLTPEQQRKLATLGRKKS